MNCCLNHIVVGLIAVSGFCMLSKLNSFWKKYCFTLLTCHGFCSFSAGVCLCFHNLAMCSPCPYCACVCFAVVLANSHSADKSCSMWHGYSGLFMSIGWCFLKEWFLIESAETHLSPDWLREEESLVWLDQTPQIPYFFFFFFFLPCSLFTSGLSWESLDFLWEQDERVSESEREGSQVCGSVCV